MTDLIETDVLIIGSGIAGGTAALKLAQAGVDVTLITRAEDPNDTNTAWAQGGIVYKGHTDSPDQLVEDILNAGDGHSNPVAARITAEEGPDLVDSILIEELGVEFDKDENGDLEVVMEAAHNQERIVHVADTTGRSIEIALINAIKAHPRINLLTKHTAIDLLTPSHHSVNTLEVYNPIRCIGAYVLDQTDSSVKRILAKKTVLASGGLGQIFLRTSNPQGSRGDGLSMAYRAGAQVINAEYVQFHPTTFYFRGAPNHLITEAVRGEGGRLTNAQGEPFMQNYDPKWKDLAPRDVVARSIHHEMLLQDVDNVYLDLRSYIPTDKIEHHFPDIAKTCLSYGVDITTDLVPVVPGAHYFCGGVLCDENGRSTIDDLYAIGEVSCTGLHGANRLASTSLLEGLVWGDRAAKDIAANLPKTLSVDPNDIPAWNYLGNEEPDPLLISGDMRTVQQVMWNYVGIVRTTPRLGRALRELRHLETEIEDFYRASKLTDGLIGLRNAVRAGIIVAMAAWENKRSMGSHYRE